MKTFRFVASALFVMLTLAACGGGESGRTAVTGIASKGPFINGTVRIYALIDGVKGKDPLNTVTIDEHGNYTADLGSYSGAILAEASGSYLDEATGTIKVVPDTAPLRAALALAQGSVSLPVTALTDLAVREARTLDPAAITSANTLVSDLFKVDIVATQPLAPTAAALANAGQGQKDYTVALAVVSQLAQDNGSDLDTTLGTLAQGISSGGMTSATADAIRAALTAFVTANGNNHTGITDPSECSLVNVGTLSKRYTLAVQGAGIRGLRFDLAIPSGTVLNVNPSTGEVLESSLALSGGVSATALLAARYASGTVTVGVVATSDIGTGPFATLTCTIPPGVAVPPAAAFSVANVRVSDARGNGVPGVSVTVQ
jgi:hypothetical protein